ncbi:cytoplasmic polyadenylation element-binding protein orb2 isoform X1 [Amblyomma americanum]
MGDYTFSVSANVRALSPVEFQPNPGNSALFFSPDQIGHTMQDDLLLEKSAGKQASSQLSSASVETTSNGEQALEDYSSRKSKGEDPAAANSLPEKTESPDVVPSPLQMGFSSEVIATSGANFWSAVAADEAFIQGIPTVNGTLAFPSFPSPMLGAGHPQRRAITGAHNFAAPTRGPPPQGPPLFKAYSSWSSPQQPSWSSPPWSGLKRSVPNLGPLSPAGKESPKFRRSSSLPKPDEDGFQVAQGPLDTLRFPLEQQLLDMVRQDPPEAAHYCKPWGGLGGAASSLGSAAAYPEFRPDEARLQARGGRGGFSRRKGRAGGGPWMLAGAKSPFFLDGDLVLEEQRCSPKGGEPAAERYSRKVFVGGLPPDIDEEEITASFRRFGPLVVDWPHKAESKSYFPPKGYAFLLFQDECSVQALMDACIQEEDKLYLCVSSPTIKDKPVQIRPWRLGDADFVLDASLPLDPRKTVFVGGVPRPLKAVELAMIMDRLYGGVCYAGIDTDPELKYPKGAGRVAFSNQQSYIAAISARFVQLQHGDIEKRVEVKPYVLDDQMCDECQGARCGGKFAPFFCANVTCLQYYCEHCWATIHSRPGREFHKPLVKEGADRPRAVPFRWC